jgi:hypothetical protein
VTSEDDWNLPDDYWAEHHADSRVTLWLDEIQVREFCRGTPQRAIETWAEAYATGRQAGMGPSAARSAGANSRPTSAP